MVTGRLISCQCTARPEVVIVDEIGTEAEALACRSIAERGVQLVGTAHGQLLENLIKVPLQPCRVWSMVLACFSVFTYSPLPAE